MITVVHPRPIQLLCDILQLKIINLLHPELNIVFFLFQLKKLLLFTHLKAKIVIFYTSTTVAKPITLLQSPDKG